MAAANTDKFKKAKRRFSTTIGVGGIAAGATTLPLTTTTGLDTDTAVTLVIEPGTADEEVITGVVSGSNIINCVRGKEGTNDIVHNAGDAVSMYFTETHWDDLINGILVSHNQDGTLANNAITTASITDGVVTNAKLNSDLQQGWINLNDAPDTITYNGNRNYDLVYNSTDLTSTLSVGQKLKLTRTVAAPDQCTDLESGSSQYFSKTSPNKLTFTDDFVCSAWIKLESYPSSGERTIVSRYNGTSGWQFSINVNGQVKLSGFNGGAANVSTVISGRAVPLNEWVHVTAQLDMSAFTATTTTSYTMIDGLDVTATVSRGGTNPTSLIQAGNLQIGAANGTDFFDGEIAQVAIYSAKVTQANIRPTISQGLTGSETSIASAFSFDNSITDLNTTTPNDLTANGSATATTNDSPFANAISAGLQEYAEINDVTFSTNTTVNVRVPKTCMIPTTGGVSSTYYATSINPYGLPYFTKVLSETMVISTFSSTTTGSYVDITGMETTAYIPKNALVKVTAFCPRFAFSAAGGSSMTVREGTTGLSAIVRNGSYDNVVICDSLERPTTGNHTYKISLASNTAGTLTFYASKAASTMDVGPAYIRVELV